jgi:putative addiction module killer protein
MGCVQFPNRARGTPDYGPGYRAYFIRHGDTPCVLLRGGDKRSQDRDIGRALELVQEI